MSKRKKKLATELGPFLQQYQRPASPSSDPNDRRYDRRIEAKVKRLSAEDFDRLAHSDDVEQLRSAAELGLAAFLRPDRRARFRRLLVSPKGRKKLRLRLAHFPDLAAGACHEIPASRQTPLGIEAMLVAEGAPPVCFIVSESTDLDGRDLPLKEALEAVIGRGMGSLLSCVPGRLGYYEGEEAGNRCILRRGVA
jgi:hypothetical protein